MKVYYYFRDRRPGNFSLEIVFQTIMNELSPLIDFYTYHTRKPIDLPAIIKVKKCKAEIHHITGAVNYLAFGLPKKRTIITVHDLGHFTETLSGVKKWLYYFFFWYYPLKRAARITAISDFTRDQLVKYFKIPIEKIKVISNPLHPAFKKKARRENKIPIILQIGRGRNKNVEKLIEAVKDMPVKLLLVRPETEALVKLLNEQGVKHEFISDLDLEQLIEAYAESDIVYFASTYEGFGLPIIEAMAIGRPVITSNLSPMKEIAGNSAILVNPANSFEIKDAINVLLGSPITYHSYVEKGFITADNYDVKKISEKYHELYLDLLRANG